MKDVEVVSPLGDAMFEEPDVPHIWVETSNVSTNMKLNRKKIRYMLTEQSSVHVGGNKNSSNIIRRKEECVSSRVLAVRMKISKRRVNQIWREYQNTGKEPIIGQNMGRPHVPMTVEEERVVKEAYEKYRFGARMLELIIRKEWHVVISHNRIHKYLLKLGYAGENERKKKRRRWVRYERDHSLSAGHIDWHEKGVNGTYVCAIIDDSSRKILAGGECDACNTENSEEVVNQVVDKYWHIRPMRELIMDRGSEFGAHLTDEKGDWDGEFKRFLVDLGILPIRIRRQHPQSNGKIEKWFDCYRLHRHIFQSFDEFVEWYNNRPHGSLDFEHLETPEQAFWRRLPDGTILGLGCRLFSW